MVSQRWESEGCRILPHRTSHRSNNPIPKTWCIAPGLVRLVMLFGMYAEQVKDGVQGWIRFA